MPVRILITACTTADCSQACRLIEGICAEYLLADKGYGSDKIIKFAEDAGMKVIVSPRKNRTEQRYYDKYLYKTRHLV